MIFFLFSINFFAFISSCLYKIGFIRLLPNIYKKNLVYSIFNENWSHLQVNYANLPPTVT